jgi:hypothetical protein
MRTEATPFEISPASYVLGIVAAVITLAVVIEMLRRRRLRERHAVWWFIAGILALIAGVFPQTLAWAAALVGVAVPINLVFFVSVAILFLVCLQHASELTTLEDKSRLLIERSVLLEMRVIELEKELSVLRASRPDGSRDLPEDRSTGRESSET